MSADVLSLKGLLKARLAYVRADLEEAMGRLKDEDLDWAPREGMRTIGGQLLEILATERTDLEVLRGQKITAFAEAEAAAMCGSVAEYREKLTETRAEMIAFIDSATEEELGRPGDFPKEWFEGMGVEGVPLSEAIRSVAQHEWYHTAQLVSYLWSRGDDPYQW